MKRPVVRYRDYRHYCHCKKNFLWRIEHTNRSILQSMYRFCLSGASSSLVCASPYPPLAVKAEGWGLVRETRLHQAHKWSLSQAKCCIDWRSGLLVCSIETILSTFNSACLRGAYVELSWQYCPSLNFTSQTSMDEIFPSCAFSQSWRSTLALARWNLIIATITLELL